VESHDVDGEESCGFNLDEEPEDVICEIATDESDDGERGSAGDKDGADDDGGPVMIVAEEPEECGYSFNHSLRKKRARALHRMSSSGSYGSINDTQTSDYKEMGYVQDRATIPDPMKSTRCGKVCFVLLICAIIASVIADQEAKKGEH
jgi:hypothetical protein